MIYFRQKLSEDFISLKLWYPKEFNRKPRSLDNFPFFKAREIRTLCLYILPVFLKKHIPPEQLYHFNALNCAIRIFSDSSQCIKNNAYAKELCDFYVDEMERLFGSEKLIYNVHNLRHLYLDVLRFRNLENFSALDFENYLQFIKKLIRKGNQVLPQIINRLNEISLIKMRDDLIIKNGTFEGRITGTVLPIGHLQAYRSIHFPDFVLTDQKPDNCCYLTDGSIVVIEKFFINLEGRKCILGRRYLNCQSIEHYPLSSST